MNLKKNSKILLFLILALFLISNALLITRYEEIWWDPAVYVGMGKNIFSGGISGLWEPSRPLVLPVILGSFLKLGAGAFFLRFLNMFFGVGALVLTYLIGKKSFDSKVGLISALALAISPTFFFFNTMTLTGIPSTFFALLSVYLFIKKKHFFAGIFSGLAFMTRFLQFFVFIILLLFLIFNFLKNNNRKNIKKIMIILIGFIILVIPYLILNQILYNSPIYPFLLQAEMTKTTGLVWHEPLYFYFLNLFKENFISIFSILGILFILIKKGTSTKLLTSILLIFLTFFTLTKHKEMRFVVVFLPYLYLLSSYSILSLRKFFDKKNRKKFPIFVILILTISVIQSTLQILPIYSYEKDNKKYELFFEYLTNPEVEEGVWISNPVYLIFSDKKAGELMYYPTFNHDKFRFLIEKKDLARHILLNLCDLYCEPYNAYCENDKSELITSLEKEFKLVDSQEVHGCRSYIFAR